LDGCHCDDLLITTLLIAACGGGVDGWDNGGGALLDVDSGSLTYSLAWLAFAQWSRLLPVCTMALRLQRLAGLAKMPW